MINEQADEKMGTRGGVRDGAGRKKSLPDGARPTTFKLTEDERLAVKKYIASMRDEAAGKPVVNIDWEAATFEMVVKMLKPYAYNMIMAKQHKEIDAETLENLLYLSRLSPESTNMETLKKQVDDIVGYFDILSKYDDSENPYDAYPSTEAEKLRDDTVVQGLEISDVKNVSKDFMDGYFQVPKVLGEGA